MNRREVEIPDGWALTLNRQMHRKLDGNPRNSYIPDVMTHDTQTALLTTVNAPYQNQLDAGGLAAALKSGNVALGQVSSFFMEIDVETQKAFALEHGISNDTLAHVASVFQDWSGQSVALAT
ncbi:hypothetical protein K1W69_03665 [Hoeflea sp. WL0058]|uniref:Uncharacterized protein n=1 Tax=Flavimaribacter sediminis TaxID=2865987 RepID=A0AAE3CYH4_9HYPH|nr:hypothetical protein [Flavimaribacter sediminis]MBW8636275.1 hypothetical protein [Flavimaribacter sediminis]